MAHPVAAAFHISCRTRLYEYAALAQSSHTAYTRSRLVTRCQVSELPSCIGPNGPSELYTTEHVLVRASPLPMMNSRSQIEVRDRGPRPGYRSVGSAVSGRRLRARRSTATHLPTRWRTFSIGCGWLRSRNMPLSSQLIAQPTDRQAATGQWASFMAVADELSPAPRQPTVVTQMVLPIDH